MLVYVSITINGRIDSLMLWSLIENFKVNLTQLDSVTYIYGEIAPHNVGELVARCALFGDLQVTIKGGGKDEQTEAEKGQT